MTSEVALRLVYFALNLVGGSAMIITFFILCLNLRRTHDGPFLLSMALCVSRIISPIISCLLLFSGSITGTNTVSQSLCVVQSGLHASLAPLIACSTLSYSLNVLLIIPPPSMLMGTVATSTLTVLLLFPFLTFAALGVVSALIASQNPGIVNIRLFYCFLDQKEIKRCSAIIAAVALLATITTITGILYKLNRRRKNPSLQASGSRWLEDIVLQIICLGLYAILQLGFLIANSITPIVAADIADATDSIIIFVILATQPWLFKGLLKKSPPPSAAPPTTITRPEHPFNRQHDSFLRRVSEYPSVIDIEYTDTRRGIDQTRRLRALSVALGLAENDPYTRYHPPDQEKRTTVIKPELEHHPYSIDPNQMGSKLSLKSVEYGVALGHPSRDASVQHGFDLEHGTPNHGRAASLIIISTSSDGSSHALHLPLDDDAPSSERHRRTPLSQLVTNGSNNSHRHPHRLSDSSPPYSAPLLGPERVKQFQDRPRRRSFLEISVESASPTTSPWQTQYLQTSVDHESSIAHSSSETRPYLVAETRTSTEEGGPYGLSGSSSSTGILVDDIMSSVLSWPNISRSTVAISQHHISNTRTPTSVEYSYPSPGSDPRWLQYASSSPEPPHPSFLREETPSPLSLNGQAGSSGGHTFGESPVNERRLHPYTRGPSPLRPPGLGSPLSRWAEDIEETTRTPSNES
ncbi:hypothetical protein M408DRAFT_215072 [Serendipita vermifera MAFF 305830]|uniref:Uncharacterized protein n=1 Tax=Serendipita vermifera MAFF 305830 TaxID=933852 RepID=A0A0C3BJD1_SERVB|nr:hypothetical protein M408DRAFT_215072 [Serendipita vermifera MAFF 305830]